MERNKKIDLSLFLVKSSGGGGEQIMLALGKEFLAKGKCVEFVFMHEKEGDRQEDVPYVSFNTPRFLKTFFLMRRYLREKNPRAILSTTEHTTIILLLAKLTTKTDARVFARVGVPLSIQFKHYTSAKDKIVAFLSTFLYRYADGVIAVSKGVQEDLIKTLKVDRTKVFVVYHPKDIEQITAAAKEEAPHHWFKEDIPVVLATGRVREQKGFKYLLRALAECEGAFRVIILGKGSEKETLESIAKEKGVEENVAFVGFSKNPFVYMRNADIFVLPSLWEGLPSALIEALIVGVPSVASDCPYGPREILAPRTKIAQTPTTSVEYAEYGVLVPPGDSHALCEAITALLADKDMQAHYKEKGRERGEMFAKERMLTEYEKVIFPVV